MDITPAMAKEMLETSPGNRRLRGWYVDLLAAAMKRGEWRVTSQGIGFDVIERCIHLWTNPGDVIFSPFTGIGSEGYCAVKMGRKFIGTELKPQYWSLACQNIEDAAKAQEGLFSELEAA